MQVRQYVVFPAPNRVFLDVDSVVASARTIAAVTSRSAPTRAARQARSVAPVVTTSSTRTAVAGAGGNALASTRSRPERFATRAAASSPTESRARRPSRSAGATAARRRPGQMPAQPEHVVTAAGRARRRPGGRGYQPYRRRARGLCERGNEQRGQRTGEVSPPALLVREHRRAQRTAVPAGRHDRRATGQHRPPERPEPGGAAGTPPRPGCGAATAGAGQEQVEQGGEQNAGRQRRRSIRRGRHGASVPDGGDGTGPMTGGTAGVVHRLAEPRRRGAGPAGVSRGRAAPRPGRRPPAGATTPDPRPRAPHPGLVRHQHGPVRRGGDRTQRRR